MALPQILLSSAILIGLVISIVVWCPQRDVRLRWWTVDEAVAPIHRDLPRSLPSTGKNPGPAVPEAFRYTAYVAMLHWQSSFEGVRGPRAVWYVEEHAMNLATRVSNLTLPGPTVRIASNAVRRQSCMSLSR